MLNPEVWAAATHEDWLNTHENQNHMKSMSWKRFSYLTSLGLPAAPHTHGHDHPRLRNALTNVVIWKPRWLSVYLSLKPSSVRATFETGIADTFLTWSSSTIQAKAQWRCPAGFVCWIQFLKCTKGLLGHSEATKNWAREVKRSEVISAASGSFGLAEEIAQRPSKFLTDLQCFSSHRTT